MVINFRHETWLPIRSEPHELIFPRVDPEPAIGGECRVKESERMRKPKFLKEPQLAARTVPDRRGGPFTDAINRQNPGFGEWRWKESTGGVRLMMLCEQDLALFAQPRDFLAHRFSEIEFFAEPTRQDMRKGAQASGRNSQVSFENTRKLCNGLVVKSYGIQVFGAQAGIAQAECDRVGGEAFVVFLSRKALFLGGSHDFSVNDESGGRIVIKSRDAQDAAHRLPT